MRECREDCQRALLFYEDVEAKCFEEALCIVIDARTVNFGAFEVTAQKEIVGCAGNDLCEKIPETG